MTMLGIFFGFLLAGMFVICFVQIFEAEFALDKTQSIVPLQAAKRIQKLKEKSSRSAVGDFCFI